MRAIDEVDAETEPIKVKVSKHKLKMKGKTYYQYSVKIPKFLADKFGLKDKDEMTASYTPPTAHSDSSVLRLEIIKTKKMNKMQKKILSELDE
ncbi:MAG: hypothetical protein KAS04_01760 [Candidatus Aenigmarchaeota archaeon]|nr:hypothetical protein [Candidatus Aenigmarchaeota archaeon]